MSRRRSTRKKDIQPDAKYHDITLARFINYVMRKGKKSLAEKVVYDAFDIIEKKSGQKGLDVFRKALEVRSDRRMALAMRWITGYARQRSERTMADRLANELMLAARNDGSSIKKKEDTHKMAEANKAFAHFRW